MMPAQQRFAAADLVAFQIDQRLVVQLELVVRERLAQVELERAARLHARVHLRLEKTDSAATVALGPIQRHIGLLEQLIRRRPVIRRDRDADTDVGKDLMIVDLVRRR